MKTSPIIQRVMLAASVVFVLVLLIVANYRYTLQNGGGNDFMVPWTGARYWVTEGVSPYDPKVSAATQTAIYGRPANPLWREDLAHFTYPLPVAMLMAPLAVLPLPLARAIWMTILELSLLAIGAIGLALAGWKPGRVVIVALAFFAVLWYPGFRAVIMGQFAVLNALFMLGALLAIQHGSDRAAGVLLGLSTLKPQMAVLLIPFVLIWAAWARRWKIILWALGIIGVVYAVSLLLLPTWPVQWLNNIIEYPQYNPVGAPLEVLVDLIPSVPEVTAIIIGAVLLIYLLREWGAAIKKSNEWFQWTAALTIVITHLIAFRTATTNYVNMFPALILILAAIGIEWGKVGERWVLLALAIIMVSLWALFVTTLQPGSVEGPIMHLPLPILLLAGLIWIRSRHVQPSTS